MVIDSDMTLGYILTRQIYNFLRKKETPYVNNCERGC